MGGLGGRWDDPKSRQGARVSWVRSAPLGGLFASCRQLGRDLPLRPCGGKVNAEFRLRFPRSEVADWAARYAYADDSEADHRRVGRKPGCYARDEFLAVTLWKIKRSRSRCANNSASTVREETEVALRASDERLRAGVLGSLAGSRCVPRGETQCGDAAAPPRAPPGPHHGPARIVAHGREPGRGAAVRGTPGPTYGRSVTSQYLSGAGAQRYIGCLCGRVRFGAPLVRPKY
jgi:hypothetical protein